MTVSGAPETAPIEPSLCRSPPPAVDGNAIAPCGVVLPAFGITPSSDIERREAKSLFETSVEGLRNMKPVAGRGAKAHGRGNTRT